MLKRIKLAINGYICERCHKQFSLRENIKVKPVSSENAKNGFIPIVRAYN